MLPKIVYIKIELFFLVSPSYTFPFFLYLSVAWVIKKIVEYEFPIFFLLICSTVIKMVHKFDDSSPGGSASPDKVEKWRFG